MLGVTITMGKVIAVIVGWLVIVACILASGGGAPRSTEGWVALIVFGPIIYLAGEAFFSAA